MQDATYRIGAFSLAAAGMFWAWGAAIYDDTQEIFWCTSIGIGFLILGLGLLAVGARRRLICVAGLLVAMVPATHWMIDAYPSGAVGPWVLLGVGVDLALLGALACFVTPRSSSRVAWTFPVAFAFVFASGARMTLDWFTPSLFAIENGVLAALCVMAGGLLLALHSGPAWAALLHADRVGPQASALAKPAET